MELREEAKKIADNNYTRNVLSLVKQGIPFNVAFSLEWHEIIGWLVILGELDGGVFDWNNMKWIEK